MKTQTSLRWFSTLTLAAALVLAARTVPAQDSATAATASAGQTAPQLSYGVSQIVQLSKAKVGDDTIINYIHNSGSSYGLDANQIVYLKQQGVSDAVINTMLSQPQPTQPAAPVAAPAANATATATIITQPADTSVPASTVYIIPDTQTYNYYAYSYRPYSPYYYAGYCYPRYGYAYCGPYYPTAVVTFRFGGGYGGGQFHGGWHR